MSERSEPAAPRGRPGGEESGRDRRAPHHAAWRSVVRQTAAGPERLRSASSRWVSAHAVPGRSGSHSSSSGSAPAAPSGPSSAHGSPSQPSSRPASLRLTRNVLLVAAATVVYALIAGGFRRLTIPAEIATFLPGVFITYLALRRTCRRFPALEHLDGRGVAAWGAVLVVFGVWELYADLRGSTPAHPTLSILVGPMLADPLHRAVGYLLWLAAGVWLVRR